MPKGSVYWTNQDDADYSERDADTEDDDSDTEALYSSVSRRQITSKSVCGICGGRGHYGRVEGMDCLTKQLGIHIPRSELALTKYPSGIAYPFSDIPSSSAGTSKGRVHGANLATSTRGSGGIPTTAANSLVMTYMPSAMNLPSVAVLAHHMLHHRTRMQNACGALCLELFVCC